MNLIYSIDHPNFRWALWGGLLPAGTLKYLTFQEYLKSIAIGKGVVEISRSCTALALGALGRERGFETAVICDQPGADYLRSRGFKGGIDLASNIEDALARCQEKEKQGFHWPRQFFNRALVDAVATWAERLLLPELQQRVRVKHVVCGFGTGATVLGLQKALEPHGYAVAAVQPAQGQPLLGWRRFETENMGDKDLFWPERNERLLLNLEGPGREATTASAALMSNRYDWPAIEILLILHDGSPSISSS